MARQGSGILFIMLKLIILIIIGILALSFFGISLESIVNSPAGQANFAYLSQLVIGIWNWFAAFITHLIP